MFLLLHGFIVKEVCWKKTGRHLQLPSPHLIQHGLVHRFVHVGIMLQQLKAESMAAGRPSITSVRNAHLLSVPMRLK